jgi:hypothetical protein
MASTPAVSPAISHAKRITRRRSTAILYQDSRFLLMALFIRRPRLRAHPRDNSPAPRGGGLHIITGSAYLFAEVVRALGCAGPPA